MVENNNNNLNEEQLTKVAGEVDSNLGKDKELTYLYEISLEIFRQHFTDEDEENYLDLKILHFCIKESFRSDDISYCKDLTFRALRSIDSLSEMKERTFSRAGLILIQQRLLRAKEILDNQ